MVVVEQPSEGVPSMGKSITDLSSVTTVGLDLAKHVFQVHAIGAFGRVIVAKALRRKDVLAFFAQLPECLVGMEACGSAHHWARELIKLGHDARMMPPAYVKPYVRRHMPSFVLRRSTAKPNEPFPAEPLCGEGLDATAVHSSLQDASIRPREVVNHVARPENRHGHLVGSALFRSWR
jgi:hypothetical protein